MARKLAEKDAEQRVRMGILRVQKADALRERRMKERSRVEDAMKKRAAFNEREAQEMAAKAALAIERAARDLVRRIIARQNYRQMQRRTQYLAMEKVRKREEQAERVLAERRAVFLERIERKRRAEMLLREYG
jgi:hypothetical protein